MKDERKTKAQLIEELQALRKQAPADAATPSSPAAPDRDLLRGFVDLMLEPTVAIDWDGNLLFGNATAAEVVGVDAPDQLPGLNIGSLVHPDSLEQVAADLEKVKNSGAPFFGNYKLLIHGRTVHIESHGTRIDLTDGSLDLVSFRDVTDRRVAEERGRANEVMLQSVLDHSSTVIFVKDVDGRYLLVNKRYEELFGVTNEGIIGKTDFDVFPPEAAERFQAKDQAAIAAGCPIEEEEIVPHADGEHAYLSVKFPLFDEAGQAFATCGISTDITSRKQAEEEARELRRNIEFILGATDTGLDIIDRDYNLLYIDPGWATRYGEHRGKKCFDYFQGHAAPCPECGVERAFETKQTVVSELRLSKEGDRPIQATTIPFQTEDGEWLVAEVKVDISERKKVELELTRMRDQLEERVAERTAELEEREKMFRALTESMNAMVVIASLDDERAIYANPAASVLTGYSFEELTAYPPPDMFTEATKAEVMKQREAYMRGEPLPDRMEVEITTKDGQRRWLESSVAIIEIGDHGMHKVVTSFDVTARKNAELAVKESEKKFRALADSTTAGISIVSIAQERFLYANQALLDRVGKTWEEFSQTKPLDFLTPEAFEAGRDAQIQATQRGDSRYRFEYEQNGLWFEVNTLHTQIDGQEAAIYTSFDITEHKRAQAAIKESEEKFRSLAESTSAQITIMQGDHYIYANQAFLDYYEMDAEDLPLLSVEDLGMGMLAPGTIQEAMKSWQAAMERGDSHFSIEYPDREGNWFHTNVTKVELDGQESMISMTIDITELKRAQEELQENEQRYRTIFETAGAGMISFGEDSVITLCNEEWSKLTGFPSAEIAGRMTWRQFFTPESLVKMKKYHELRSKDPASAPRAYESQLIDRDGQIHDGIINIQVVPGTQQRVASFQDMTALKRAQNEMYRADKMAALGQIIAGVAHEINNPNNFIYFNLPILRRYIEAIRPMLEHHLDDDPDLKVLNMPYAAFLEDVFKLLDNMEHGSERITSIVSELKTYVHSDSEAETKTGAIGPVIDRVMALVGKQVRKMVKNFEVTVADGLPPLKMNEGKIEQVLINLVINAGQAADKEDSWVKLTARTDPAQDARWIEILVEDNGTGVPDDIRDKIFEPFFTSKGRESGTGLGLSISHRIVEEHGGTIEVDSTPGQGTSFTIRLPAASR